jgi:hypothetical protein
MSNTKYLRELLETVDVLNPERACERISEALQELRQVEADRAKDAELIQMLVDEVSEWMQPNLDERFRGEQWHQSKRILDAAAEAAGFKPSDR